MDLAFSFSALKLILGRAVTPEIAEVLAVFGTVKSLLQTLHTGFGLESVLIYYGSI